MGEFRYRADSDLPALEVRKLRLAVVPESKGIDRHPVRCGDQPDLVLAEGGVLHKVVHARRADLDIGMTVPVKLDIHARTHGQAIPGALEGYG